MTTVEFAFRLDEVEGLGFTIYAGNVTFWAAGTPLAPISLHFSALWTLP